MKRSPVWNDAVPDVRRFPVLSKEEHADVVVIGGGIVGITTAWLLAQEGKRVVLLEKNHLATGDSGATTGFLTHVPDASIDELIRRHGVSCVKQIFSESRAAQQRLFERIQTKKIDCDFVACETQYVGVQESDPVLEKEWQAIKQVEPTAEREKNFVRFPGEGKFHIRKYLTALLSSSTVQVFEESEALSIELDKDVLIRTSSGCVRASRAVVAIGDPSALLSELQGVVEQVLTHVVLATVEQPQIGEELIWDTRDPYFYYRRVGADMILIGGCDAPAGIKSNTKPVDDLKAFLQERFGPAPEITHSWSGSLFETKDGLPYVFAYPGTDSRLCVATGFGGNGLVYGSWAAEILRDLILGHSNPGIELLNPRHTNYTIVELMKRQKAETLTKRAFVAFGPVSEIPEGRPVAKTIGSHTIMVVKMLGKCHAVDNRCTHAGGSLCDGDLKEAVITCPLHGAKFDVTTGEVKGPPAIRPLHLYPTRVVNGILEVELSPSPGDGPLNTKMSQDDTSDPFKKWRVPFLLFVSLFWVIEILAQRSLIPGAGLPYHLLVASAFTGATLISCALFSSAIFKWFPRTSGWWRLRRYFGVSGFVFATIHVMLVWATVLHWDLSSYLYSFNPIENPMLFGSLAFPIFLIMALTSTDWAVDKLTFKRWKRIHRLVYIAFPLMILHYVGMKPDLLSTWPGIVLGITSGLALLGQLYWFARITLQRGFKISTAIGLALIITFVFIFYSAFRAWQ